MTPSPDPLPDTGQRAQYATGAVRDASIGKGHFHSIPPTALRHLAKRFEDGYRKYSGAAGVSIEDALHQLDSVCTCENTIKQRCATQTAATRQRVCVSSVTSRNIPKPQPLPVIPTASPSMTACADAVTTNTSRSEIQNTRLGKKLIAKAGVKPILSDCGKIQKPIIIATHLQEQDTHAIAPSPNLISPLTTKPLFSNSRGVDAGYVEAHQDAKTTTSTTITRMGRSEDCSADDVIKDSDCLEMILSLLKEHSPSCEIHRRLKFHLVDGRLTLLDRKPNWQKGIALSHYQDSLTRHLLQYCEGDTSEDHAGAIIWNACCMVWTDEEIQAGRLPKELDDLPYRPGANRHGDAS
jgi:hypothetical protein